jgi:ABC-type transporter Mla maintaining outer membrane lipid asymmetry ATPase subunit MlaF
MNPEPMNTGARRPTPEPEFEPASDPGVEPLVKIRALRFSRQGRRILDDVDLDIARGKVTAIMGPSGTGKTTLLKLISGQLHAGRGSVDGRRAGRAPASRETCIGCARAWACCFRAVPC